MAKRSGAGEGDIRSTLRTFAKEKFDPKLMVDEFWIPLSHERADLVVFAEGHAHGFEIKSSRDKLDRLPRQCAAYERLFEFCSVVVASKHLDRVCELVPAWWGILVVHEESGSPTIHPHREPVRHQKQDVNVIVRLLWRDEAASAIDSRDYSGGNHRSALWRAILDSHSALEISRIVREAIISRDPTKARIPTRRFTAI